MCNAWNHPPGCNCGWGGTSHGRVIQHLKLNLLNPTEESVATQMGISKQGLRDEYSHLYQRYMDQVKGIILIMLK